MCFANSRLELRPLAGSPRRFGGPAEVTISLYPSIFMVVLHLGGYKETPYLFGDNDVKVVCVGSAFLVGNHSGFSMSN